MSGNDNDDFDTCREEELLKTNASDERVKDNRAFKTSSESLD